MLVEAALLMAVTAAATAGDIATLVTAFALSNSAFVRVIALAPASVTYIAFGFVLLGSSLLHRGFGYLALALRGAFEVIGTLALFSQAGVILAIWLSITQELWIVAAAVALLRRKDVS